MWGLYEKLSLWRPRNRQDETGCRTFWQVENETEKRGGRQMTIAAVSYTHLDVYKRQAVPGVAVQLLYGGYGRDAN